MMFSQRRQEAINKGCGKALGDSSSSLPQNREGHCEWTPRAAAVLVNVSQQLTNSLQSFGGFTRPMFSEAALDSELELLSLSPMLNPTTSTATLLPLLCPIKQWICSNCVAFRHMEELEVCPDARKEFLGWSWCSIQAVRNVFIISRGNFVWDSSVTRKTWKKCPYILLRLAQQFMEISEKTGDITDRMRCRKNQVLSADTLCFLCDPKSCIWHSFMTIHAYKSHKLR